MAAHKISSLLTAPGELGTLSAKARRLSELQQVFINSAPPQLASASRVKNFRAGTLFLLTDNATVAAKLRQLVPRVLLNMQKTEAEITGIQIQVQVNSSTNQASAGAKNPVLSPEIIEKFKILSQRVPDQNLKSALVRFVRRRTKEK